MLYGCTHMATVGVKGLIWVTLGVCQCWLSGQPKSNYVRAFYATNTFFQLSLRIHFTDNIVMWS